MTPEIIVYNDAVFAVGMINTNKEKEIFHLSIKYAKPEPIRNQRGQIEEISNIMGGETDWFILPHTFAVGVVKVLIELKVSGMFGFSEEGFQKMVNYFVEMEDIQDGVSY